MVVPCEGTQGQRQKAFTTLSKFDYPVYTDTLTKRRATQRHREHQVQDTEQKQANFCSSLDGI
jgi:hypothetical protein